MTFVVQITAAHMNNIKCIALLLILIASRLGFSATSDTLRISIGQADSIFLARNLSLLASGLNIDIKKAQVIQAGLYPNPVFTADINAYDPQNNRAFHVGNTGQKTFQLEQLILLGGKRRSWIEMAKTETSISELEFTNLLKQLKYQLRSSFYYLDQQAALIVKYDNQIKMLTAIIDAYEIQASRGNVPLKDVVRLKGVSLDLRGEKAELIRQYTEELIKVQTLLQTDMVVQPIIDPAVFNQKVKVLSEDELITSALASRPDFQIVKKYKELADLNLQMEKRTAIPDVNLFTSYDQRGGAFNNQVNVGFSIPLPVWNRNQGNIRVAELKQTQQGYEAKQAEMQLVTEVKGYLSMYNRAVRDYEVASGLYNSDFDFTADGMSQSFQKGNIGLIEFVDFFESYNEALGDYSKIKVQLGVAAEQLNYIVGKELF